MSSDRRGFRQLGWRSERAGKIVELRSVEVEAPDGERVVRELVHHPGAVVAVALGDGGKVLMVRQYRTAADAALLELPAGKRDVDGEDPVRTLCRELAEEVGRLPGRIHYLGGFYNSPGISDEWSLCYLAADLVPVPADPQGPEERYMETTELSFDELWALEAAGELVDAKTLVGLGLAERALRRGIDRWQTPTTSQIS